MLTSNNNNNDIYNVYPNEDISFLEEYFNKINEIENENRDRNGNEYKDSKIGQKNKNENDLKYELNCHPILYFLLILYNSIDDFYKKKDVYQCLKRFLLKRGLIQDQMDGEEDTLSMNELIFYCMDTLPEKLINTAKIFTIKNCYQCEKKKIRKRTIINTFVIYSLGCLVYDDKWYKYEYSRHGWRVTTELEILQDINIFFPTCLEKLCNKVRLSLDGFTNIASQYLCVNVVNLMDIEHLNSIYYLPEFRQKIDKKPILRFNDCVYDFQMKRIRPGRPNDFCVKSTGYDYYSSENNKENRELIMKFFKDVFEEEELITYVLKLISSTLTLGNKFRALVFFIGCGRNGKTALTTLIRYALGDYAALPNVSLFLGMSTASDKPNPHMMVLNNARVALCEEPDAKISTITGDAKAITGNVGFLKSRTLFKDLETIYVDLLPIINTNYKLTITNIDTAIIDRIIVIPFLQRFVPSYNIEYEEVKKEEDEEEEKIKENLKKEETDGGEENEDNKEIIKKEIKKENEKGGHERNLRIKEKNVKIATTQWQGQNIERLAPAFVHILLNYYQDDYTELMPPTIVKEHTNHFIYRCDHIGRFISQKLVDVNSEELLKLEEVYTIYKKWYKTFVTSSVLRYTISEFKIDLLKYKIRVIKGHPKSTDSPEVEYLIGYQLK